MTSRDRLAERLLATFLEELDDVVRALNADLLALEADAADGERLRAVFRAMHTLKGAARAAGVVEAEALCHDAEGFLVDLRDRGGTLAPGQVTALFRTVDRLEAISRELRAGTGAPAADASPAAGAPHDAAVVPAAAAPIAPETPPMVPAAAPPPTRRVAEAPANETATPVTAPSQPATPAPTPVPAEAAAPSPTSVDAALRVSAERLDALVVAAGELLTVSGALADRPAELEALAARAGHRRTEWRRLVDRVRAIAPAHEHPGLHEALDAFEDGIGEAGADAGRLARLVREDARGLAGAASRLAADVRLLRMRPVGEVTESLPRAARDLGQSLGKRVRLVVRGEDVQADRAVLDVLRDALLHLLRNAVDHGLELPAERRAAGKPEEGTVTVAASVVGDRLELTVADDGRGIDVAGVRRALERRGIVAPADDAGAVARLLHGGVSTRDEATAISGRGVGLDAVREAAERLGGTLDVAWRAGEGTTFRLHVPVSVATTRVLLARAGGQTFALPSHLVARADRHPVGALRRVGARAVLPAEPEPLPVLPLAELLGAGGGGGAAGSAAGDGMLVVVTLAVPGRRFALAVDELVDEREVIVRPLDGVGPSAGARFAGAVLGRDDDTALVVDPAFVIAAAARDGAGASLAAATGARPATRPPRVLVVDDSLTTRTLEESVLAAAGYDVATAVDGADGWRVVRQGGVDLVVSDVEMPNMDGLALCAAIRASREHARLPVILVTSLDRPEQRAAGLEAGADAYITKSSFDQADFLATVRQLVRGGAARDGDARDGDAR